MPAEAATRCALPATFTAPQVVWVDASGSSAATRACLRTGGPGVYTLQLGPMASHVGRNGVAPLGSKREGDGRTPGGMWALRGGFGTGANPGLQSTWFTTDSRDVWVDDSRSSLYNTHQRTPVNGRWTSAENLRISAYAYTQVIGYNELRTPGMGSAIFLHVDQGGPTAGCVSLPTSSLLAVMRWERPGAVIYVQQ